MAGRETEDMQQMRRDAIRRTQEMVRRAQAPPGYTGSTFSGKGPPKAPPPKPAAPPPAKEAPPAPPKKQAPAAPGFFEALFSDGERNLLLSVLLLLMQEEHSDPALLFALLYLLL
ncbi:MAG: hypothetical protein LKE53_10160 [Oscillospiraceae bacterium]|jgi:hypothetical protein|nr:hypothetical protein [Oscillospiraceae bacterium]